MNLPLFIRADAGGELGTGHVMRMLALAQAWQERGGTVNLATVKCPNALVERLRSEEVIHHRLNANKLGSKEDSLETIQLARETGAQWVVLDGYHFDIEYQRAIHTAGFKVMILDDYGHCGRWCADLILNQNIGSEERSYHNEIKSASVLLGTKYTLLRKEFLRPTRKIEKGNRPIKKLLITLGGVDADNVTGKVLKLLEDEGMSTLEIRIIVGAGNPHQVYLSKSVHGSKHNIEILQNVISMPELYEWADGVISAGGSTCYEWLLYRIPAVIVLLAENQKPIVQALSNTRRVLNLGWWYNLDQTDHMKDLIAWVANETFNLDSEATFIDGKGASRVSSTMIENIVPIVQCVERK